MDNSTESSQLITDNSKGNEVKRLSNIPCIKWILFLAVLYTLYFAQSLIIPIVLTILIALLLSPLVAACKRIHIPRAISSIVLLSMLATPFTLITIELTEPAEKWAKLLPKLSLQVTEQFESISSSFEQQQQIEKQKSSPKKGLSLFDWFSNDDDANKQKNKSDTNVVTERIKQGGMEVIIEVISATPFILTQILTGIILILFLLIFGPNLFAAFVKELPNKKQQQKALDLVGVIQSQLSRYISTVSIINFVLGLSTAIALSIIGLEDALLWGVIVGVLNFIPYAGMIFGVCILALAGTVQYGFTVTVLIPIGAYLTLNLIESQFITPMVLGKNMQLNPLVVILWLLLCGWLWGLAGVLLSVPLLVCIKLVLTELGIWKNWLRIIEAGA
ncbi:AI-2E family transporter [Paraglaciecola sp. L3A3]|uniref:AI-2E family transporter n=1 Tax=Paraglaciecola sp. L3A3 TaxID=2686358 RepID=UPI00131B68D3|nr:AI-2E family transporter [Paraglaciecola sp. L3A3]